MPGVEISVNFCHFANDRFMGMGKTEKPGKPCRTARAGLLAVLQNIMVGFPEVRLLCARMIRSKACLI